MTAIILAVASSSSVYTSLFAAAIVVIGAVPSGSYFHVGEFVLQVSNNPGKTCIREFTFGGFHDPMQGTEQSEHLHDHFRWSQCKPASSYFFGSR